MSDTNVTAAVTDSDNIIWANASYVANLVGWVGTKPPTYLATGQPVTTNHFGTIDASGNLAVTLAANNAIAPFGTQWEFKIQPLASVGPSIAHVQLSGANQDISAALKAQIIAPRVQANGANIAYADIEIQPLPEIPTSYINSSSNAVRVWNGIQWQFMTAGITSLVAPFQVSTSTGTVILNAQNSGVVETAGTEFVQSSSVVTPSANKTQVRTMTTGETIIDSASGQPLYMQLDRGNGVFFGNGAGTQIAAIDNQGTLTLAGALSWAGPKSLADNTDLNTILPNGYFIISNGAINAPPFSGGDVRNTYILSLSDGGGARIQLVWGLNDPNYFLWKRIYHYSTWMAWTHFSEV